MHKHKLKQDGHNALVTYWQCSVPGCRTGTVTTNEMTRRAFAGELTLLSRILQYKTYN